MSTGTLTKGLDEKPKLQGTSMRYGYGYPLRREGSLGGSFSPQQG